MALRLYSNSLFGKSMFDISPEDGQGLIFAGDRQIPKDVNSETEIDEIYLFNEDFSKNFNKWTITTNGSATSTITSEAAELDTGATEDSYLHLIGNVDIQPTSQIGPITITARVKHNYSATNPNLSAYIGLIKKGASTASIEAGSSHYVAQGYDITRDGEIITNLSVISKANGFEQGATIARTTNYVIFKIVFSSSRVDFYVDGTRSYSIFDTNDIPINTIMNPIIYIKNYGAAVNEEILIDYFTIEKGEKL